jgi:hydroxymethylpyrimidine pyrophosphatase-like HAD family hydrolase
MSIKLLSTDFDGTLFAEFHDPPVPMRLQEMIANLQRQGAKWIINTGRDMSSLMEALARAQIEVEPDYLVLVEREIYLHHESSYVALQPWNTTCDRVHSALYDRLSCDLPGIVHWINSRFHARIYEDPFSPFCLIASSNEDMDRIVEFLEKYTAAYPELSVVRNDVYARFSHVNFNKGTALAELSRRLNVGPEHIFAAGDHLNDLPMLKREYAHFLATPGNGVPAVKARMRQERGFISRHQAGEGIIEALEFFGVAG